MAQFKLTGLKEIDKALSSLEPKLQKKVLRQAMRKAMKIVAAEAKENAPVDEGTLKASIKVKAGKKTRNAISINVQSGEGDFKGDTYYASFIEYGTSKRPATPFMRPAFDSKAKEAKDLAIKEILDGVERESKKN